MWGARIQPSIQPGSDLLVGISSDFHEQVGKAEYVFIFFQYDGLKFGYQELASHISTPNHPGSGAGGVWCLFFISSNITPNLLKCPWRDGC